ncbi:MAG: hypothetical protein ACK5KT_11085 [Dysgonomonas sp.]
MNKYKIIIFLFFCSFSLFIKSQDKISVQQEDISGRWMENKHIEGDNVIEIAEHPDTYIFRDNMVFHKGEAAEGVIIFNITGRYTLEGNLITIYYKDYLKKNASAEKAKKLVFEVLSLNEDKTEMSVLVHDYDYEYKMELRK